MMLRNPKTLEDFDDYFTEYPSMPNFRYTEDSWSGIQTTRFVIDANRSSQHPDFWHVSIADLQDGYMIETKRPILGVVIPFHLEINHVDLSLVTWKTEKAVNVEAKKRRDDLNRKQKERATKLRESLVYFIQPQDGGLIKIGWCAGKSKKRLGEIQTMSPVKLIVLGTVLGGFKKEKELHKEFASIRSHGEWFHPEKELLQYIETNARKGVR